MGSTPRHRWISVVALAAAVLAPGAGAELAAERAAEAVTAAEEPAPALEIVVNVPAGELAVLRHGQVEKTFPVSVGTRRHPTPMGAFELTRSVWNPWWHPPESWWARDSKPQPPGPGNAMGRAKLYFKPLYFIHGTAETDKLGTPASHGCVRMANEDVLELARLVHRHATPDLDSGVFDALVADSGRTREFALDRPVPLRIVYQRVDLRGDLLVVYPDVYGWVKGRELARQVAAALQERGEPAADVDRLAGLLDTVHEDGGTIPLGELLGAAGEEPDHRVGG